MQENGVQIVRAYSGAGDRHVMASEARLEDCMSYLMSPENIVEGTHSRKGIIHLGGLEHKLN